MGKVAPERLNPVPLTEAPLIVTDVVPVAVKVTDCVAAVFRLTVPNAMVVALTLKLEEVAVLELPILSTPLPDLFLSCFDVAVTVAVEVPETTAGAV